MKLRISLILLNLFFVDQILASSVCGKLFEIKGITDFSIPQFKKYDPNNIDQQIDRLLTKGDLKILKQANAQKTHLPFFEDYVLDTISRLIKIKIQRNDVDTARMVEELGVEAYKRIAQEDITYEWIMNFSYKVMSVFEGHKNFSSSYRNLDRMVRSFPHDIFIPTFAELDFKHFIQIEGNEFTFLGMIEKPAYVDGNPLAFTPEQFSNHDFLHYYLTQRADVVLSPKNRFNRLWLKLHKKIENKIQKIPESRRRFAEYIYFYILHEEFGLRSRFLQRYVNPSDGKMSQFASQILDFETITNHYNGIADPINISRSELYNRTTRPSDFIEAFSEKTNPQEILLVGIGDFLNILREIESEPAD